jgi:branched-chain amino acid transport system permease protein
MENLVFTRNIFSRLGNGVNLARPGFAHSDLVLTYVALGVFALFAALIVNLRRSTTGLVLGAARSSQPAARTLGISILQVKLLVATLATFVAAIGGALYALAAGIALPSQFTTLGGLIWLAVLVSLGIRSTIAALIAGLAFTMMPGVAQVYLPHPFAQVPALLFGLGAIAAARYRDGILSTYARSARALVHRLQQKRAPVDDLSDLPTSVRA